MHLHILTYIIFSNVGYWCGEKITSKQLLSHTKKVLSMIKNKKSYDDYTEYYLDGKLHRENDLPAVEWNNVYNAWYKKGKRHREGGLPAVENNGSKEWWVNGKLIRRQ